LRLSIEFRIFYGDAPYKYYKHLFLIFNSSDSHALQRQAEYARSSQQIRKNSSQLQAEQQPAILWQVKFQPENRDAVNYPVSKAHLEEDFFAQSVIVRWLRLAIIAQQQ
jgi:hypothetical protein